MIPFLHTGDWNRWENVFAYEKKKSRSVDIFRHSSGEFIRLLGGFWAKLKRYYGRHVEYFAFIKFSDVFGALGLFKFTNRLTTNWIRLSLTQA